MRSQDEDVPRYLPAPGHDQPCLSRGLSDLDPRRRRRGPPRRQLRRHPRLEHLGRPGEGLPGRCHGVAEPPKLLTSVSPWRFLPGGQTPSFSHGRQPWPFSSSPSRLSCLASASTVGPTLVRSSSCSFWTPHNDGASPCSSSHPSPIAAPSPSSVGRGLPCSSPPRCFVLGMVALAVPLCFHHARARPLPCSMALDLTFRPQRHQLLCPTAPCV
jgi:hypothetical protein